MSRDRLSCRSRAISVGGLTDLIKFPLFVYVLLRSTLLRRKTRKRCMNTSTNLTHRAVLGGERENDYKENIDATIKRKINGETDSKDCVSSIVSSIVEHLYIGCPRYFGEQIQSGGADRANESRPNPAL